MEGGRSLLLEEHCLARGRDVNTSTGEADLQHRSTPVDTNPGPLVACDAELSHKRVQTVLVSCFDWTLTSSIYARCSEKLRGLGPTRCYQHIALVHLVQQNHLVTCKGFLLHEL